MAEWVQKGNLKGPQGPKGEDATLPEGGTEGQFLKKTATGEEWGDVPAPDMSGYVKYSSEADKLTYDDGTEVSTIRIGDVNSGPYLQMSNNQVGIANRILNQSAGFGIHESSNHPALYLGANQGTTPKSVTGITDSISDSPEGLNLATDKAVADYVTAHAGDALPEGGTAGQVLTKTEDGEAWADASSSGISVVQAEGKYGTRTLDKGMKLYGVVWIDDTDNTALSGLYPESTLETIISSSNIGTGTTTVDISDNGSEFVVKSTSARVIDFYGIE